MTNSVVFLPQEIPKTAQAVFLVQDSGAGDGTTIPASGGGGGGTTAVNYDINVTSKNAAGSPLIIQYWSGGLAGTLAKTQTITYDIDGDFKTAVWS
jgi:hypothetical protein